MQNLARLYTTSNYDREPLPRCGLKIW